MPDRPPLDPQVLVREADAIARLARHLLADPDRADDASQETMRIALERGPRPGFGAAAWLRGVLRNVVRRLRRTDRRRLARERAAAVDGAATSDASAERLARRRAVIEAVLVLPEDLRTAIELRFFEGLPPRAIARRLGIPVETARSRVRRALGLLRVELDRREGGDGRRWALALAPIAFPGTGGPRAPLPQGVAPLPALLGGLMMGAKAKAAVAACLVLLLGGFVWRVAATPPRDGADDARAPAPAALGEDATTLAAAPRGRSASVATEAGPPRLRVTGLVTDPDGAPLAGASIHAADADVLDDRTRPADVVTDAAGRFTLERDGAQVAWRVSASMPGRRSASVTASAGAPRDVVLRLGRTVPLWIAVADAASGRAIEGAEVTLTEADEGGSTVRRATTDREGLTSVQESGVRPMGFESVALVHVSSPGHRAVTLGLDGRVVAGSTARSRPYRVTLEGSEPLQVVVTGVDGRNVPGAAVRGWNGVWAGSVSGGVMLRPVAGGPTSLGTATTDEQGRASLATAPERWYVLARHGPQAALVAGHGHPHAEVPVALRRGVTIDGVVVDESGGPVSGVPVSVDLFSWFVLDASRDRIPVAPPDLEAALTVSTESDGRFSLQDVPRRRDGRAFAVAARLDDRYGHATIDVPPESAHTSVRIELKSFPRERLEFFVRSTEGTPIAGALIGVPWSYPAVRTDLQGHAHLGRVSDPTSRFRVSVSAPGFETVTLDDSAVRRTGATEIVLGPEGILDLRVVGPDRRPVAGAQVAVVRGEREATALEDLEDRGSPRRLAERHTDVDGRVRVDGLPRGPIWVAAEHFEPDRAPSAAPVRSRAVAALASPGPAEIVLPFSPLDAARGRVVEGGVVGADGALLSGRAIAALQSAEPDHSLNLQVEVLGGRFWFDGVPPGRYQLQVYGSDASTPILADIDVREGTDVRGLTVARTAPGRIVGRVIAEGGADASGLPIEVIDLRGLHHVRGRATTDAAGTFAVDPLPAGTFALEIRAPAGPRVPLRRREDVSYDVGAGAEVRVELRAVPAGRLVLRCDDERVGPRPDGPATMEALQSTEAQTNLVLEGADGAPRMTFGLHRGRNEMPWALAPGRYRIRIRRFDRLSASHEFDVRGPGDVEVDVVFPTSPR